MRARRADPSRATSAVAASLPRGSGRAGPTGPGCPADSAVAAAPALAPPRPTLLRRPPLRPTLRRRRASPRAAQRRGDPSAADPQRSPQPAPSAPVTGRAARRAGGRRSQKSPAGFAERARSRTRGGGDRGGRTVRCARPDRRRRVAHSGRRLPGAGPLRRRAALFRSCAQEARRGPRWECSALLR